MCPPRAHRAALFPERGVQPVVCLACEPSSQCLSRGAFSQSHCWLRVMAFPAGIRFPNNQTEETVDLGHSLVLSRSAGLVPVCWCVSVVRAPLLCRPCGLWVPHPSRVRKQVCALLSASLLPRGLALLPLLPEHDLRHAARFSLPVTPPWGRMLRALEGLSFPTLEQVWREHSARWD